MNALTDPIKFDDVQWHVDSAVAARQPAENAGVHIALYLGWLIRRSLHDPEVFADELVNAIKRRDMSGSAALEFVDGMLVSDHMIPKAASFTNWYYDVYLSDYDHHFGHQRPYTVVDDRSVQDLIETVIDDRYAEWLAAGRPEGERT